MAPTSTCAACRTSKPRQARRAVTQTLVVDATRVMTMVEIRAERDGRALHNFAAFLAEVEDGRVRRLWMVDARPAYSEEFWS